MWYPMSATAEEVWIILRELAQSQKETEHKYQEMIRACLTEVGCTLRTIDNALRIPIPLADVKRPNVDSMPLDNQTPYLTPCRVRIAHPTRLSQAGRAGISDPPGQPEAEDGGHERMPALPGLLDAIALCLYPIPGCIVSTTLRC